MRLRLQLGLFAILLATLVSATGASATLLYSGGEDVDFICNGGGSCTVSTTTYTFRPAWARSAYEVYGSISDPAANRFATSPFSANPTSWVHAQYCNVYSSMCNTTTAANAQMLRVMDSNGNPTLIVRGTGTAGQVKVSSRTSSGTFTDLVTCSSAVNTALTQIDLYVNYGTSGEIRLYNNSQQVCSYTGDVTNGDGATTLNQIEFSSVSNVQGGTSNGRGEWSEVIVATTDTRAMSRFTANTLANGNTVGFSGTNVCSAIWNAIANNDANYGYSGTANTTHECTIKSTIPAGSYNVLALVMSARALVGTSGPQHFDFVTRTGGTDYTSADFAALPSFSNISNYIQTVNPATSAPWTVSDFSAVGFNVGEETKP
ncbi:hypothetical protein [Mesorhizobium sp.]|uniref:hypothetical protein n=1 Tax=Mesorhizobium sp. TaxID=1871066 RepID=UPI000FE6B135|nr:hypothetical protein [Mesorhizobium sp.]RWA64663.1 MAG: hypothetical protein EOQ29_27985 [Mesorhizobium sp.]RWA82951.1 MAG: hypothetical protein EOQ30_14610 [Mesorhizobium sp.]